MEYRYSILGTVFMRLTLPPNSTLKKEAKKKKISYMEYRYSILGTVFMRLTLFS